MLRVSLGFALLAILLGACQQTLLLDDRSPDASLSGTGGKNGSGGSGVGPSDAAVGSPDARCSGAGLISFTPDTSQILVALDRSSAMGASFGGMGGESQLQVALDAIQTYVSRYSGAHNSSPAIQFAFLDFPDPANNCSFTNGCCASAVTTNYADFEYANTCSGPMQSNCLQSSNRPTAAALEKAYEYYSPGPSTSQHSNERYVVLITDDVPGGSCSGNSTCGDAITAVDNLSSIGVTTEVVAIGQGALCLSELATAQAVFPSPYYVASGPMDLSNAIELITAAVAQNSCRLTLFSPPTSGYLTVKFNNMNQMQDGGTNGNTWNYGGDNNNARVYLHGMLCANFLQTILQGTPSSFPGLQIYDGCPSSGHGSQSP